MIQVQTRIQCEKEGGESHIQFDILSREDVTEIEKKIAELIEESMKVMLPLFSLDGSYTMKVIKKPANEQN